MHLLYIDIFKIKIGSFSTQSKPVQTSKWYMNAYTEALSSTCEPVHT